MLGSVLAAVRFLLRPGRPPSPAGPARKAARPLACNAAYAGKNPGDLPVDCRWRSWIQASCRGILDLLQMGISRAAACPPRQRSDLTSPITAPRKKALRR